MFLKAINEYESDNLGYVNSIIQENFLKLLNDKIELDKNNAISNLIMSIEMNRLLCDKFTRFTFKNNEKEISKYFESAKLYTITDKRIKDLDINEDYLEVKKNTLSLKDNSFDIVLEKEFSLQRLNYFIDLINDVLIDGVSVENYDYYKSQYLYLTLLYFDSINYDKFTGKEVKVLDDYLDRMREGIENNYLEAFILNAKNRYYNLNPYSILCPIKEIKEIEMFIDELNTHIFDDENEKIAVSLMQEMRKFIVELKRDDIPQYKRNDLLSDSDYLSIKEFFMDLKEGKIDDSDILKERKLENLLSDVKSLIDEIKRKRD